MMVLAWKRKKEEREKRTYVRRGSNYKLITSICTNLQPSAPIQTTSSREPRRRPRNAHEEICDLQPLTDPFLSVHGESDPPHYMQIVRTHGDFNLDCADHGFATENLPTRQSCKRRR
jgi:hypothetical protein